MKSPPEEKVTYDLGTSNVKLALAFASYKTDTIRLTDRDLRGFTHLTASRQGLFAVNSAGYKLIAHGFFFGITVRDSDIFVFECCDLPRGPTFSGRLLRFILRNGMLVDEQILIKGLDNGCHQIDFIDGRLHVIDTYNQQILRFHPGERQYEVIYPIDRKPERNWKDDDLSYRHVNTILAVGDEILLLLHNGAAHTGRKSEIAVFTRDWRPIERWTLDGTGCHSFALLEDGSLLTCGSMEGTLLTPDGFRLQVSSLMTRGLSVTPDSVVVGVSKLARREGRMHNSGFILFMDRSYNILSEVAVPGAPMEVRRIDGQDASLSDYVERHRQGVTLRRGHT